MALQNQFTLSLELTNLVPGRFAVVNKTWDAALSFARKLQSSRSDIVIEEDLALKFGRCRIADNLSRSFRTVIEAQNRAEPLQLVEAGLTLVCGTGPTVVRALTEGRDGPYFAMVVQCSLLVATHLKRPLAAALSQFFEKEAASAPAEHQPRAVPSAEGLEGTLQAIEDQTTSFDWRHLLFAVGRKLNLEDKQIHGTIPTVILQGAITMLQSVQRFPEERLVIIEVNNGAAVLTVWAHHVLGLSVLVRTYEDNQAREERFGEPPEQVLIDVRRHIEQTNSAGEPITREDSITLLSIKDDDKLILKAEPDDEYIDGTFRGPLRGFAKRQLAARQEVAKNPSLGREMALITAAMAFLICRSLRVAACNEDYQIDDHWKNGTESGVTNPFASGSPSEDDSTRSTWSTDMPVTADEEQLLSACQILFDDLSIKQSRVNEYINLFQNQPLTALPVPVGTVQGVLSSNEYTDVDSTWSYLRLLAILLSVALCGFASVARLDHATKLPLYENSSILGESTLAMKVMGWDGNSPLHVAHDASFEIVSHLMLGEYSDVDISEAALVSTKGWSVFMGSLGNEDPAAKGKKSIFIEKGVPCRNQVWKHLIVDATSPALTHHTWHFEAHAGVRAQICCHEESRMKFGTPYCGERRDSFVLSLRLLKVNSAGSVDGSQTRRTGYNEQHNCLWRTKTTQDCIHGPSTNKVVTLPPGCVTISGFGDHGLNMSNAPEGFNARVYICLTAGVKASRWRAILAAASSQESATQFVPIMIRGVGCCFQCALNQVIEQEGTWFLVL